MEADKNNNYNSDKNNKSSQRRGTLVKKLNNVKSFISDHIRLKGRSYSLPGGLEEKRSPLSKKSKHAIKKYQSMNLSSPGTKRQMPYNGQLTNGSLPHLYPIVSTNFNGKHDESVLPLSDDDLDEWCIPYPCPSPLPSPDPRYSSLDHFHRARPTIEPYRSVDNFKSRNRKQEIPKSAKNGKDNNPKNTFQFGSLSYSIECSSSATDINKIHKNDTRDLNKSFIVSRSYSDAHVYNQNAANELLPPSNPLSMIKKEEQGATDVSYHSLDRKNQHKFKFEERKRKVPFGFSLQPNGINKFGKDSTDSFHQKSYTSSGKTKIIAKVSLESIKDEQTDVPKNNKSELNRLPTSVSTEPPIVVQLDSLQTRIAPPDNNDTPIVVKIDSSIFNEKAGNSSMNSTVSNFNDQQNRRRKPPPLPLPRRKHSGKTDEKPAVTNKNIKSTINHKKHSSDIKSVDQVDDKITTSFWNENDLFHLDDSFLRKLIENETRNIIGEKEYKEEHVHSWTRDITCNIRDKVRAYTGRHYKIVVNSFIGSIVPSDADTMSIAVRGSADSHKENFVVCAFQNENLFVSVTLLMIRNLIS